MESLRKKITSLSLVKRVIILLAIVGIGLTIYFRSQTDENNGYIFATVERQSIIEKVSESGNISIAGVTEVYSPTNGVIEEVYVTNGQIVGIEDNLFKVKSTATEDEKAAAYATLAAKQAALKTAQQNKLALQSALETARKGILDAQEAVDDKNDALSTDPDFYSTNERDAVDSALTTARYDFNTAEKKYVEADVAIGSAQAAVASALLDYESTKDRVITSPTIGTISNLSIAVGSTIDANGGLALLPAMNIANFSSSQIILEVNESDISKIEIGQSATIYPDAVQKVYQGAVTRVDDLGQDDEGVITYNVYIDILNFDEDLKSGMTVDVDIVTSQLSDVLSVPNTAIKPYEGGKAVRVLDRVTGEVENVPVTIGVKGEKYTQILNGVDEGTEIVVSLKNSQVERSSPFGF